MCVPPEHHHRPHPPAPPKNPQKNKKLSKRNKRKKPPETPRNLPKEKNKKKDTIHDPVCCCSCCCGGCCCFPAALSLSLHLCLFVSASSLVVSFALLSSPSFPHHPPPPLVLPFRPSSFLGRLAPRPAVPTASRRPDARSCVFSYCGRRAACFVSDLFFLQCADVIQLLLFPMIAACHGPSLRWHRRLEICVVPSARSDSFPSRGFSKGSASFRY